MDLLQDLTEEQARAVEHGDGPLLIVAGAGTGKTTVLTRRIAHLILSGRAKASEVLALTFTDKAAQEMQERVDRLLPLGYIDSTICTFHSFGDKVLRQFALELGLQQDYKLLDDTGQVLFLREHLFRLPLKTLRPLGNPTTHLRALKQHFSRLKDECIEPETYVEWAEKLLHSAMGIPATEERARLQLELAQCYLAYQKLLLQDGRCDFADLVYRPLQLLRQRPGLLERLQRQYRYILVDEFQDTNGSQCELVRLLAGDSQNLTVVGDDDQSIYAFRGAAISNILEFLDHYPQAEQVVLTQNFRSLQPILDVSYDLVRCNNPDRLEVRNQIDKELHASRTDLEPVLEPPFEYSRYETASDEAEAVAQRIADWTEQHGFNLSDFAILIRTNRDAQPVLRALNQFEIAYRFSGNEGLYRRPEVRMLTSIVRVLSDPHDGQSLFFLLTSDFYGCPSRDLVRLSNLAQREHTSLLHQVQHAIENAAELQAVDKLERFQADYLYFLEMIPRLAPGPLLYQYLQRSPWWESLCNYQLDNAEAIMQNVARFFDVVRRFSEDAPDANLTDFVRHLDLLIESGDSPTVVESDTRDEEAVQILTVHRSKGLEFPVVFMVGLNEERFPSRLRPDDLEFPWPLLQTSKPADEVTHLQEERRLFYVALTRAQRHLWLSGSDDSGQRRKNRPSRFVREALGLERTRINPMRLQSLERIRRSAPVEAAPRSLQAVPQPRQLELSQQKIHDYEDCPHRYWLAHVMRVPQPDSHNQAYGTAVHEAISWFLKERRDEARFPDMEELKERFRTLWRRVGCLNADHADARFDQGLETMERFWMEESQKAEAPTLIEQEFSIRLDDVRIRGRIDRVDQVGERVRITDYKSSNTRTQGNADQQAAQSIQLSIYAFAYQVMFQKSPDELVLHFVESNLEGKSSVTQHPLEEHTQRIRQVVNGIRSNIFTPRPSIARCRMCSYRSICDHSGA